ncbi:MAG: endonuclease/exonuclease/phosphatase family protein [Pseudomonadota bacterium]
MRLVTYNVEWFDALFDEEGALIDDDGWSGRQDVTRAAQTEALGAVFQALEADAVLVVEAPDQGRKRQTVRALESFAARFDLRMRKAVMGFKSDTQQELALLFDPDVVSHVAHDPMGPDMGAPRFDGLYQLDLDTDATPDPVVFSKPPLELQVQTADGRALRLIGVHAKSKAPHGAKSPKEVMAISIANRRKQLAQCIWLRKRVEAHLQAGDSVIVMGDFNDGPGLDAYEQLFGRSSVEIVLGEGSAHPLFDPHAHQALSRPVGARLATARFYIQREDRYLSALLDYIMVSDDLRAEGPRWRIWHPFDDPACYHDPSLREALLTASDHFPVSIDLPSLV